jgi:N-acetylmuramoyl-L-alanine amidase
MEMRKKDFIYFASAAVLLGASVQVAHADEVGMKESAVAESEAVTTQASSAPVVEEKQEVGTHQYAAPAPVTELPVTSSEVTKTDESQVETKPISGGESIPSSESTAKPVTGTTTFYSAGSKAPSGRTVSTLSRPQGDLSIENNNEVTGTFDAVVRNVVSPTGLKEVLVPSWSLENGQDDLIWHKATKQIDGSYRVTIKASEHKGNKGNYRVDAYIVDNSNNRHYIAEKVVSVDYARPSGVLTIENNNTAAGTFDAVVRNIVAPTGLKEVLVPSWSLENGQDDLIWHKATRQTDGSYQAPQGRQIRQIRVAVWSQSHQENLRWYSTKPNGVETNVDILAFNHGNLAGDYTTHVYVDYTDDSVEGFNLGKTKLSPHNPKVGSQTAYYFQ